MTARTSARPPGTWHGSGLTGCACLSLLAGCGAPAKAEQAGGDDAAPSSSGSTSSGGASSGGASTSGGSGLGGTSSSGSSGGSTSSGGAASPDGGYGLSGDGGACSSALSSRVKITEIDVGVTIRLQRGRQQRTVARAHAAGPVADARRRLAPRVSGQRRRHGPRRHARRERPARRRIGVRPSCIRLPGHLCRRRRRRPPREPIGAGLHREQQLRQHRQPLRADDELPDDRLLLRHVHGALRRRGADVGHQAHRHDVDAACLRHQPDGRRQRHLHLVGVRAQRAHRLRRRELRRLLRRGHHGPRPGVRRVEHLDHRASTSTRATG